MSHMFYGCTSLISLPDISKWNTNNVQNFSKLFYGSISLSYTPNLCNWNFLYQDNKINLFIECLSLIYEPKLFILKFKNNMDNTNQTIDLRKKNEDKLQISSSEYSANEEQSPIDDNDS